MAISSRFAVAVHVLALLERGRGEPVPSERIAASVGTNPAVIRRILCMLSRAGLTRSRLGTGGGALLARPAGEVTLLDVYRAVEDGELFTMHAAGGDGRCPVGRHIEGVLEEAVGAARLAMEEALARRTLADVCGRVRARCVEREGVA